jgi:hypothetical protein
MRADRTSQKGAEEDSSQIAGWRLRSKRASYGVFNQSVWSVLVSLSIACVPKRRIVPTTFRHSASLEAIFLHGCAPSSGRNGNVDLLASMSCDAAASAGDWRSKPRETRVAFGGSRTAPRLPWRCPTSSSHRSVYPPSQPAAPLNLPNRRIRTRTYGGVGGRSR